MLASWIPKEDLMSALEINPFEKQQNSKTFRELLGIENYKPFECVGTHEEMIAACERLYASGAYADDILMKEYSDIRDGLALDDAAVVAEKISQNHFIPQSFMSVMNNVIE